MTLLMSESGVETQTIIKQKNNKSFNQSVIDERL